MKKQFLFSIGNKVHALLVHIHSNFFIYSTFYPILHEMKCNSTRVGVQNGGWEEKKKHFISISAFCKEFQKFIQLFTYLEFGIL